MPSLEELVDVDPQARSGTILLTMDRNQATPQGFNHHNGPNDQMELNQ